MEYLTFYSASAQRILYNSKAYLKYTKITISTCLTRISILDFGPFKKWNSQHVYLSLYYYIEIDVSFDFKFRFWFSVAIQRAHSQRNCARTRWTWHLAQQIDAHFLLGINFVIHFSLWDYVCFGGGGGGCVLKYTHNVYKGKLILFEPGRGIDIFVRRLRGVCKSSCFYMFCVYTYIMTYNNHAEICSENLSSAYILRRNTRWKYLFIY